jgi:hypothetical protein
MSLFWKEVADFGLRVTILGLNCPIKDLKMAMANRHYIPGRAGKHVSREPQGARRNG